MKGKLRNTDNGYVVEYQEVKTSLLFGTNVKTHTFPLHTKDTEDTSKHDVPTLFDGKEVEFVLISEYPESCHDDPFCMGDETCIQCLQQFAKLIP